jgi:hypothetical protein
MWEGDVLVVVTHYMYVKDSLGSSLSVAVVPYHWVIDVR